MSFGEVVLKIKPKDGLIVTVLLHEVIKDIGTESCWVAEHEKRWSCKELLGELGVLQNTRLIAARGSNEGALQRLGVLHVLVLQC